MSRGFCSPEQRANCPLQKCEGTNTHHLGFPGGSIKRLGRIAAQWRELPFNKAQLPVCLHNAIHESRYFPEIISRDEMLAEIWAKEVPERAIRERNLQEFIGRNFMNGDVA